MDKNEQKLRKNGYKLTRPRQLVLNLLKKNKHLISANEIVQRLKGKIDLVSVYRTLHILEDLNIIYSEKFENKKMYYISAKPHHHIICRKCGYCECIPCRHKFETGDAFVELEHRVELSGICKNCH